MSIETQESLGLTDDLLIKVINNRDGAITDEAIEIMKTTITHAVGVGENFVSEILRVRIEYKTSGGTEKATSLIVKLLKPNELITEDMISLMNAFPKELTMYQTIVPAFENIWSEVGGETVKFGPSLYYTVQEPRTFLLFEDLSATGYKMGSRLDRFDLQETELVLTAMTKWHAASLVHFRTNGPYSELYKYGFYNEQYNTFAFTDYFNKMTKAFINKVSEMPCIKLEYKEAISKWQGNVYSSSAAIAKEHPGRINVLNHGDLWLNNIMFTLKNGHADQIKFIDFQLSVYASPAIDILYFLLTSVKPEVIVDNFDKLIEKYHASLVQSLQMLHYSPIPTLFEIQEEIRLTGSLGSMQLVEAVSSLAIDHENDGIDFSKIDSDGEEGDRCRRKIMDNPRFVAIIEKLIPFFGERGML